LIVGLVFAIAAVLAIVGCVGYKKQLDDKKALRRSTFNDQGPYAGGGGVELDSANKPKSGSLSGFGEPSGVGEMKPAFEPMETTSTTGAGARSTLAPPSPQVLTTGPTNQGSGVQVVYPTEGGTTGVGVASVGWTPNPVDDPAATKQREFEAANGMAGGMVEAVVAAPETEASLAAAADNKV
jgi:hypothetical protein